MQAALAAGEAGDALADTAPESTTAASATAAEVRASLDIDNPRQIRII